MKTKTNDIFLMGKSKEDGTALEGINLIVPALNEGTVTNKKENLALDYPMGIINLALKV